MSLSFITKSRVVRTGQIFFCSRLIVIGCQHFFFRQFVPMVVPLWPSWIRFRFDPLSTWCLGKDERNSAFGQSLERTRPLISDAAVRIGDGS